MRFWSKAWWTGTMLLLILSGQALASGITNSSDDLRTGWYPHESAITPGLISGPNFGQEWSASVEGQVYAQPLLDDGTLLVATEQNKVYGLDPATGAQQWSVSLGTPWNPEEIHCGDLSPSIGITGTPVIDQSTQVAYMTHKTYASGNSGAVRWYMDAIEMATGHEKAGFPVELSGKAQNAPGQTFFAKDELQRPGLLLLEGVVYAAFGSDCDVEPFQGWVFGVSESGSVKARWTSETNSSGSGIWQSGAGLTSDGPGTILISTGNGSTPRAPTLGANPPGTLGEAIVRLRVQGDGTLAATDFFAPYDAETLAAWDADFASGGVTGLPNAYFGTGAIPHLAVAVGKDGYVYLLNRDNLGGIGEGPGGSDAVVQRLGPYGGVWSRPGVWPGEGGWVYIPTASNGETASGSSGNLRVYRYRISEAGAPTLALEGTSNAEPFGFSSGAPVITSNETESGSALVWLEWSPNGTGVGAQLRAYNPVPVHGEPVLRWSAPIGTAAKFATPGVGGGRLYVGTRDGHVLAFGSPVTPPLSGPTTVFPTTTVGEHSPRTVTLTANQNLTLTKLGSSSAQFEIGSPSPVLPASLKTGEQISVPVTFSPGATGPQAATMTATTSTGSTIPFSLEGAGRSPNAMIEVFPTVLTVSGASPGESRVGTATFRNVGGSSLTVEEVTAPSAPFRAEGLPTVGKTVLPEGDLSVQVTFEPSEIGSYEDAIVLKTSGGTGEVHLTGVSAEPGHLQITPEALEYGPVTVGGEKTAGFTVANTGGTAITIFKSKPPDGSEFTATSALPEDTTIAAGEVLTETVRFAPTATGPAEGLWLINGQGSSAVHEVRFSGSGVPATPATPPSALLSQLGSSGIASFQSSGFGAVLASARLTATSRGIVPVRLRCPAQPGRCQGTLTLRTLHAVKASTGSHRRILTLATVVFSIAGGHSATLHLRLSRSAVRLLHGADSLPIGTTIVSRDAVGVRHVAHRLATLRLARTVTRR
jgi:hypothetical protein